MARAEIDERVYVRLLKPVMRFFLRRSCTIQVFLRLAKIAAIEAAVEILEESTTKINVSRISMLTGITRPEVKTIYKEGGQPSTRSEASLHSRVMNRWEQSPEYSTKSKKPRVLTEEEFKDLVDSVVKHINPGTVLFEMQRSGAVEKGARGLKLLEVSDGAMDKEINRLELLGDDIDSLFSAVRDNIKHREEPRNLHIRTEYNNVSSEDLEKIRNWFLKEGQAMHRKVRTFLSKYDVDINAKAQGEGGQKAVFSTFSHTTRGWEK